MKEEWKSIPGYEGRYEASTIGRIKSLPKKNAKGRVYGGILSPRVSNHGYRQVALFHAGARKEKYVHRLVAETFLERKETDSEVNHINGIKDDNRLVNLEWTNRQENMAHALSTGLWKGAAHMLHARWGIPIQ